MRLEFGLLIAMLEQAKADPWGFFKVNDLRDFQSNCHPDRWPDNRAQAEKLFLGFQTEHDRASVPQRVLKSPKAEYKLIREYATGDLRTVHLAQDGILVKIPRVTNKQANNLIAKEAEILSVLSDISLGTSYARYLPKLVESFVDDGKRINVTDHRDRLVSMHEIRKQYPDGIDGRHIGWMMKRLLTVAGYAHNKGYVHGAITPEHAMFCSENHGGVLCGWIHTEKIGDKIKTVPATRKDWYPTDAKICLTPAVDIYMIGRLMLYGMNPGECPQRLRSFIQATQLPVSMRPKDAWELCDDLTDILRLVYGVPKFVVLEF